MQLNRQQYSSIAFLLLAFLVLFLTLIKRFDNSDLSYIYWPLLIAFLFSKAPKLKFNLRWLICLALITLFGIASTTTSKYPDLSFFRIEIYKQFFLFSFAIYLTWRDELSELLPYTCFIVIVVFLLLAPFTLYEYFQFAKTLDNNQAKYISTKLSYYGHIRHFSYHAFIACCCGTTLWFKFPHYRKLFFTLTLCCLIALLFSGGRAALIAFFFFVACCSIKLMPYRKLLFTFSLLIFSSVLILILLKISPFHSIVDSLIYRSGNFSSIDHILSGRPRIWNNALNSLNNQTFLIGMGPGSYLWTDNVQFGTVQPHSMIIQLIIEYGYLGGSVILMCCCYFLYPLYKSNMVAEHLKIEHLCLCCFFAAYLVYSLVDGLFYHAYPMLHLAIIIPIWFSISNSLKKQ